MALYSVITLWFEFFFFFFLNFFFFWSFPGGQIATLTKFPNLEFRRTNVIYKVSYELNDQFILNVYL